MNQRQRWLFFYSGVTGDPVVVTPPSTSILGSGDLTTVFLAWLAANAAGGDINTRTRDALATYFASGENEDLTTLVTRLDDHNLEPGSTFFAPIYYLLGDTGYLLQENGFKVIL